ncbi:translation initiation inhibitor, yjgF family protein [Scytonema sp. UIC 10036]|uniref:RidA family protein n=1 Tax=Scytonema sp. UIC 10036 TaxID=2304196 RepID=UPI0012DA3064|nr:RidA family protein [Scytonema sp. UIC 10036]MUG94230.1 translation initiation inhibitor, yjgF family protein [Scytonema sp. UIC 10036]
MKKYISQWFRVSLWLLLTICVSLLVMQSVGVGIKAAEKTAAPSKVTFYGSDTSPISSAVAVPTGQAYFWTSGTVPPAINPDAPARTRDRYGDTKTQAIGTLKQIQTVLQNAGLSLADVIYLRVYLVADPDLNNQVDYQGWFDAYGQFFNTQTNPTKVARSTVAVAGLVDPGWLIEIEAVAVYPKRGDR